MKRTRGTDSPPRTQARTDSSQSVPGEKTPPSSPLPQAEPKVTQTDGSGPGLEAPPSDLPGRVEQAPVIGSRSSSSESGDASPSESEEAVRHFELLIEELQKGKQATLTELGLVAQHRECEFPLPAYSIDPDTEVMQGLYLPNTDLDHDDYARLASALKDNATLEIVSGSSPPAEFAPIFKALIGHPSLQQLEWSHIDDIRADNIPAQAVDAVIKILGENRLHGLALFDFYFSDEHFRSFTQAIAANTRLESLSLVNNKMVDSQGAALGAALLKHQNLCNLELDNQLLEDYSPIAKLLRENSRLESLSLADNALSQVTLMQFVDAMSLNRNMRFFDFGLCYSDPLSEVEVKRLLQAIRCNPKLQELSFQLIFLRVQSAQEVREFFEASDIRAPLSFITLPKEDRDSAESIALMDRLRFLERALADMESIKEHVFATLLLHLRVNLKYFPQEIVRQVLAENFVKWAGIDATLALAKIVGYAVPAPESDSDCADETDAPDEEATQEPAPAHST